MPPNIILMRDLALDATSAAIDPVVLQREKNSEHHWLFGTDQPAFRSLTGSEYVLTQWGTSIPPALTTNYVTVANEAALSTGYWKANLFTICLVAKYESDNTGMYIGNYTGAGSTGLAIYGRASASNGLQFLTDAATINLDLPTSDYNDWVFIGASVSATEVTFYCPQSDTYSTTGWTNPVVGQSAQKFSIGNHHYNSAPFGTEAALIAETCIFDTALTLTEMEAVYLRSQERLALRSITI